MSMPTAPSDTQRSSAPVTTLLRYSSSPRGKVYIRAAMKNGFSASAASWAKGRRKTSACGTKRKRAIPFPVSGSPDTMAISTFA